MPGPRLFAAADAGCSRKSEVPGSVAAAPTSSRTKAASKAAPFDELSHRNSRVRRIEPVSSARRTFALPRLRTSRSSHAS